MPMRPCRRGAGSRRSVWYSRMVRTGSCARWASSSTVSSTASAAWVSAITWTLPVKTVTVNTVTMTDELPERLLAVLRTATGNPCLDFAAPPEPLTGGFWAELLAIRLAGAPAGFDGDLVARVMPDPALARKETLVQAEVARCGFPTPKVRAAGGPGDGLGRAFMVMDRAPGTPLLAGLDGTTAFTQLPRLATTVPEMLAVTMSELHRIDPGPLRRRLTAVPAVATTVAGLLDRLRALSEAHGRTDLAGAARRLAAHPPPAAPEVICHGDLHPFNLLAGPAGAATVLDWSAALLGPRAYDVGFTTVILTDPPVLVPASLRPAAAAAGRMLSRRFEHRYRHHSGVAMAPGPRPAARAGGGSRLEHRRAGPAQRSPVAGVWSRLRSAPFQAHRGPHAAALSTNGSPPRSPRSADHHAQPLAGGGESALDLLVVLAFGEDEAQVPVSFGKRMDGLADRDGDGQAGDSGHGLGFGTALDRPQHAGLFGGKHEHAGGPRQAAWGHAAA